MKNRDTQASWSYHEATKHSYASVRANTHVLDWVNRPLPFKIYPAIEPLPLPRDVTQTGVSALSAIAQPLRSPSGEGTPDFKDLSRLLYFSAGITRHRKYPGGEIYFRAAACTGALYEVELYLVCGDLANLEAGVYHFAAEFGLRRLRARDYRSVLIEATAAEPAIAHAPLTIVCTCTYWRNAWKYQARTYRHFGWDNGTLLANLLAVATAQGLPAKVVCGFVDSAVNRLLDVDSEREVAFSVVAVGHDSAISGRDVSRSAVDISPLNLETVPLSRNEIDYPLMREMHAASSLASSEEVAAWRERGALVKSEKADSSPLAAPAVSLERLSDSEMPRDPIEQVILRRGSSRQFARTPISLMQ